MLAACRCKDVDRPPVWLMRQAGRYLPEYQELKGQKGFWTLVRTPELASEITLQPVRRFAVDAAIVFCDILVVPDAMGIEVKYVPGPVLERQVRTMQDVRELTGVDAPVQYDYLARTLEMVKAQLDGTALIGFAGAPLTLAAYMIEGKVSPDLTELKTLAYNHPEVLDALLSKLVREVTQLLLLQVRAGADLVQLFDTWGGRLTPDDYERWALPAARQVIENVRSEGVPVILYVKGAAGKVMQMATSGADALSVDAGVRLSTMRKRLGPKQALQGNLEPVRLLGPEQGVREGVARIIGETRGRGHIVNLGHGVLPPTPVENVEAFVDAVHRSAP